MTAPTLDEMIEAVQWAATRVEFPTTRIHLDAAGETLRKLRIGKDCEFTGGTCYRVKCRAEPSYCAAEFLRASRATRNAIENADN